MQRWNHFWSKWITRTHTMPNAVLFTIFGNPAYRQCDWESFCVYLNVEAEWWILLLFFLNFCIHIVLGTCAFLTRFNFDRLDCAKVRLTVFFNPVVLPSRGSDIAGGFVTKLDWGQVLTLNQFSNAVESCGISLQLKFTAIRKPPWPQRMAGLVPRVRHAF